MIVRLILLIAAAAFLIGVSPVGAVDRSEALAQVSANMPTVRWDRSSFVQVNLAGTDSTLGAVVGYVDAGFVVALIGDSAKEGLRPLFLKFGIGQAQDSLCATPVRLQVQSLTCDLDGGGSLPGCQVSGNSQELVLSDGDCDPITVYWDHKRHGPSWWRN